MKVIKGVVGAVREFFAVAVTGPFGFMAAGLAAIAVTYLWVERINQLTPEEQELVARSIAVLGEGNVAPLDDVTSTGEHQMLVTCEGRQYVIKWRFTRSPNGEIAAVPGFPRSSSFFSFSVSERNFFDSFERKTFWPNYRIPLAGTDFEELRSDLSDEVGMWCNSSAQQPALPA